MENPESWSAFVCTCQVSSSVLLNTDDGKRPDAARFLRNRKGPRCPIMGSDGISSFGMWILGCENVRSTGQHFQSHFVKGPVGHPKRSQETYEGPLLFCFGGRLQRGPIRPYLEVPGSYSQTITVRQTPTFQGSSHGPLVWALMMDPIYTYYIPYTK